MPKITKKKLNIGHLSELSLILHSIIRSFFLLNNINNQMFAINFLPLVPMRAADSERSEMISQLLYGETVTILESTDRWLFVENTADQYRGWVDKKMLKLLDDQEYASILTHGVQTLYYPLLECENNNTFEKMYLPGGSRLYSFSNKVKTHTDVDMTFDPVLQIFPVEINGANILKIATMYLNAPYLWGGKSLLGIDCSGLVQVVFSICGIQLPRDASQQVEKGDLVNFLGEAQQGDLAFFDNEAGNITHVGILLDTTRIIHASGWVKIEKIDNHGIISSQTGEYTHKLKVIKRLINSR